MAKDFTHCENSPVKRPYKGNDYFPPNVDLTLSKDYLNGGLICSRNGKLNIDAKPKSSKAYINTYTLYIYKVFSVIHFLIL